MRPILTAALLAAAAPAMAQELTQEQRDALAARVAEFDGVMRSDMAGTLDFLPPRLLSQIAQQSGVSEEDALNAIRAQIEAASSTVTIDDFAMDLDAAAIQATPDGSRTYALIPTTTEMTVPGQGSMRARSQTVAIEDDGQWYLLRIDDPSQVAILQAVYPEFAGVTFTPGTVEPIQ